VLYNLLYPLREWFFAFNIFRYITFRSAMAAFSAFLISLIFGPALIRVLKKHKIGEKIRKNDGEKLHELMRGKEDTPTMGGLLILLAVFSSTLLWADISNKFVHLALFSTLWLGITGFIDDYLKQVKKKSKGLTATAKLTSQILLGLILGTVLYLDPENSIKLGVPFFKNLFLDLNGLYILFVILVIAGSSNAVNLTDGLDGLAAGIVVMIALAFAIISYVSGNKQFSGYLLIPYIRGSAELTVFCGSIVGAGLGFLWFNCYPASIFMGDVGSLSLGGALATVAILIKKELLLLFIGGILVIEALSVILQVGAFRFRKKRIFKIAPLHHHFQFLGWPESKVIVRFWILAGLLALLTIITLKIR